MLSQFGFSGAVLLSLSLFCGSASAAKSPRLIQTSPTQRQWMSEREILDLSRKSHDAGHCGGFMDVTDHPVKKAEFLRPFSGYQDRLPTEQAVVSRLLAEVSASNLEASVKSLSTVFPNRFYQSLDGVGSSHWIRDRFLEMSNHRNDVTVQLFKHGFAQPSVIARIQGKSRPDEIVVIGAHEDSVNWQSGDERSMIAPGADDDASGVATVLETFRVLMESGYQPERTLEFMAYAGEELGLLGSQDIAESYQKAHKKVVAVAQFDMTMYPGASKHIAVITDYVDPGLTRFTKMLVDTYVKVPWVDAHCGYACSDHASWTELGYASVFPFEAPDGEENRKIHTAEDTLNILDMGFGEHFAKLAVAFAVELANGK